MVPWHYSEWYHIRFALILFNSIHFVFAFVRSGYGNQAFKSRSQHTTEGFCKKDKDKKKVDPPQVDCLVCGSRITEANEEHGITGDNAVFCEGKYDAWVHRPCIGLSKQSYEALSELESPYLCPHCMLSKQTKEIEDLKRQAARSNPCSTPYAYTGPYDTRMGQYCVPYEYTRIGRYTHMGQNMTTGWTCYHSTCDHWVDLLAFNM